MRRVIVELKKSATAVAAMTAEPTSRAITPPTLPGLAVDMSFSPVTIEAGTIQPTAELRSRNLTSALEAAEENTVIIRGELDEANETALKNHPDVVMVWTDGEVAAFGSCQCEGESGTETIIPIDPSAIDQILADRESGGRSEILTAFNLSTASPCPPTDCAPTVAKGTLADVANYLSCNRLWAQGIRGGGVAVGIVDTGVNKTQVPNVVDGWTPNPSSPWGEDPNGHGSMCATDVLGMAPDAQIYDMGLLKSTANMTGFLSDAIAGFQWAITKYRTTGKPQILSNSWGMFQKAWAPDYCTDPNHPFTRKVVEAINAGMIVTFAAGNCGQMCPSSRCGSDTGPGRSIWGANGHPRVITVGAANIKEEWIGYTSQGPAALDPRKPDFVAPSHFKGYTASDNGTSAANPVCAGVIALLRGHDPQLRQDPVKTALQETAKDLCGAGWDPHSGHGMINAERAFHKLNFFQTPLVHAAWIHGHAARVERPERLEHELLLGFYSLFKGKPNTDNWFHFALPTPVIVSNKRLRLDSIMLLFWTDPNVHVYAVHVWDANTALKRYDGLNLSGSHWFTRFDVLNNHVRYGIGVSVGVRFTAAAGERRILFGSCGGDFIA
jgi:serine protease AprX